MSNLTGAPGGAPSPPTQAVPAWRVLFHEHVCPDCGSGDITEAQVETGDGITEIALTCTKCGTAWPVACVVDWDNRP